MCNIEARQVNTRPVSESVRSCNTNEVAQLRQELNAVKSENAQLRTDLNQLRDEFDAHRGVTEGQAIAPGTGCLQPPSLEQCGAPAGRGLQTNPEGWPQGSVRTAGGYTVVPEGKDAAWSIFGPEQKPGETPMTRVWGDPHVNEKDGTRWDFTKNSNFRLPDGTMIGVDTTSQTGQSVSKGLTIANGADLVRINGIDQNKPTFVDANGQAVGARDAVTREGYEYRNERIANNPNQDTFVLGGNGDSQVHWFRERGGEIDGLVTGARHNVDGKGSYDQIVDKGKEYWVCPNLQPPVGSRAWGNQLRSEVVDAASHALPKEWSRLVTAGVSLDDAQTRFTQRLQHHFSEMFGDNAFGGLARLFGGGSDLFGGCCSALNGMGSSFLDQWSLMNLFGQNRQQMMYA